MSFHLGLCALKSPPTTHGSSLLSSSRKSHWALFAGLGPPPLPTDWKYALTILKGTPVPSLLVALTTWTSPSASSSVNLVSSPKIQSESILLAVATLLGLPVVVTGLIML